MATMKERQRQVQLYRGQIPSPGAPTVAWREDRVRFWAAIARGVKTDDAAAEAGVSSPAGSRWFRQGGGMPTLDLGPLVGRYLSFSEREEIALLRARGQGVREIARRVGSCPIDDLTGVAPQRRHPAGGSSTGPWSPSGRPIGCAAPEDGEARPQRGAA